MSACGDASGRGERVLVDVADRVATLTLNRPEVRNALDGELIDALRAELLACEASDAVDVVIVTGADPAFCAGLDLGWLGSQVELARRPRHRPVPCKSRPTTYEAPHRGGERHRGDRRSRARARVRFRRRVGARSRGGS